MLKVLRSKPDYRAVALAIDGKKWVWGAAFGRETATIAANDAMAGCLVEAHRYNIRSACELQDDRDWNWTGR